MLSKQWFPLFFIGTLLFANSISGQTYQTAVGARFGGLTSGLTVKHFVSNSSALEGILSVGRKSFIVTGLYEKHAMVNHSSGFNVFYGLGAHIGFFRDGGSYYYNDNRLYTSTAVVGVDGILGMDYKFKDAPINVALDFKPFVDFFNGSIVYLDGGLSIRYTF